MADLLPFAGAPPVAGINETLGQWAEDFIGVFQKGAETFVGLVTGIIPLLIILLTAVHALIKMIGPERIDHIGEMAGRPGLRYYPIRYLVLPVLAVFFLTNPMCYTMGRFLPERDKPAFYDSAVSFVHPPLGLFPHVNAGELFVWAGIAAGITQLKLPLGDLAVRYFYVGLIVIFMRGIVTETISRIMFARRARDAEQPDEPEVATTAAGPVTIRENSTAGTPTSTVSGSASPNDSPTGMKSHPTWGLMANRAGSAYWGGILPWPICTPIRVPTIWAMTAPGPSSGDSTGRAQMIDISSSPGRLEARPVRRSAIQVPIPVARMTPMISEMKAMNGRTLRITMSIDSRPAW